MNTSGVVNIPWAASVALIFTTAEQRLGSEDTVQTADALANYNGHKSTSPILINTQSKDEDKECNRGQDYAAGTNFFPQNKTS